MKVAFDVVGTLKGPKKDLVLKLFHGLQSKGHECVVWSSLYSYALEAIEENELKNTEAWEKQSRPYPDDQEPTFDLAIDDDRASQQYLNAKKFVFVDELTEEKIEELLK